MTAKRKQLKAGQYCLKPAQIEKLINSCTDFRNRLIVKLAAYCGLRREEIAELHVENVDLPERRLWIPGKGDKRRLVPIPDEVFSELSAFLGRRKGGWVFVSRKKPLFPIDVVVINRVIGAAGASAGIKNPNKSLKNINPHCLRHSYARMLKDRGVPMEAIQAVMGHSSIRTTMDTYGLLSDAEIQESVQGAFSNDG